MNRFYYSLPTYYKLTTKVLQTSTNLYSSTTVWLRNPEFADVVHILLVVAQISSIITVQLALLDLRSDFFVPLQSIRISSAVYLV